MGEKAFFKGAGYRMVELGLGEKEVWEEEVEE